MDCHSQCCVYPVRAGCLLPALYSLNSLQELIGCEGNCQFGDLYRISDVCTSGGEETVDDTCYGGCLSLSTDCKSAFQHCALLLRIAVFRVPRASLYAMRTASGICRLSFPGRTPLLLAMRDAVLHSSRLRLLQTLRRSAISLFHQ